MLLVAICYALSQMTRGRRFTRSRLRIHFWTFQGIFTHLISYAFSLSLCLSSRERSRKLCNFSKMYDAQPPRLNHFSFFCDTLMTTCHRFVLCRFCCMAKEEAEMGYMDRGWMSVMLKIIHLKISVISCLCQNRHKPPQEYNAVLCGEIKMCILRVVI